MPSDNHNSLIAIATGLTFITVQCHFIPRHAFMPTMHSSSNACIMVLQTKAHLCSPLHSILFSTSAWVTICSISVMALVQDLGKCSTSMGISYVILCLEYVSQTFEELEAKQSVKTHCFKATYLL